MGVKLSHVMSKCGNLGVSQSRNDSVRANGSIERSQQMGIPKKAAVPILNGRRPSTSVKCEVTWSAVVELW